MKKTFWLIFISAIFFHTSLLAQNKHDNLKKGLAIEGFDPVAYITENRAIEGRKSISLNHNGATYYFNSEKNKGLFLSSPDKYVPAYGGWCAYAMGADGIKVKIDPETFKVINGKTYLFYNFFFNNTLEDWEEDEAKLKKQADLNWEKIVK